MKKKTRSIKPARRRPIGRPVARKLEKKLTLDNVLPIIPFDGYWIAVQDLLRRNDLKLSKIDSKTDYHIAEDVLHYIVMPLERMPAMKKYLSNRTESDLHKLQRLILSNPQHKQLMIHRLPFAVSPENKLALMKTLRKLNAEYWKGQQRIMAKGLTSFTEPNKRLMARLYPVKILQTYAKARFGEKIPSEIKSLLVDLEKAIRRKDQAQAIETKNKLQKLLTSYML